MNSVHSQALFTQKLNMIHSKTELTSEQWWDYEWTMLSLWVNNILFMSKECSFSEWTRVNDAQFMCEQCW